MSCQKGAYQHNIAPNAICHIIKLLYACFFAQKVFLGFKIQCHSSPTFNIASVIIYRHILDYSSCEDIHVGFKQLNAGGDCFTIHFEKLNWYEARTRCKQRGHDLATLRHKEQRDELANKIRIKFGIFKLYHFWIGFRNSDWFYYKSEGMDWYEKVVLYRPSSIHKVLAFATNKGLTG